MDSCSRDDTLLTLFYLIRRLRGNYMIQDELKFHWNDVQLLVVRKYVFGLRLHCGLWVLNYANLLDDLSRDDTPRSYIEHAKTVASFARELREFFSVPRRDQLFDGDNTLKENELLAAFISFLLQLLYHRTDFTDLFEGRINRLEKELRFLLTVLGDTILVRDEQEQVQNLLQEFEAVANEAGNLVHSIFFSTDPVFETMDVELGVVLKHTAILTDSVMKFLDLPFINLAYITPRTSVVDSLVIVDSLLYDLVDLIKREDNLIADMKDQLKVLQQGLIFSLFFIQDIGGLRPSLIAELKEPLMQIGGGACEAEYLINSFLVGDAPFLYITIRLTHVIDRIELIGTGLQEIKKNYDVGAFKVGKGFSAQPSLHAETMSEIDDATVGFEDKVTHILDLLVAETKHLQIIFVFGMPGLGKTTLAYKLYNHSLVSYRFDKSIWCVVSQTYQRKSLLVDIWNGLTSEVDKRRIQDMGEEDLVEHIYKSLKGRRYLFVMDDIWSSNAWYDIQRCFPDDANGSRILFTSRNKDVAPTDSIIYELPSLSYDQCWELLEKKVFHNKTCPPELIRVGKEIASNCHGLPLAVVVTAGILSTMDKDESTWKNVMPNLASYIFSDQNSSILRLLELSYEYLPDHLKPCFLYFGAFHQQAKEIPVRKLMMLWIAEGLVHLKGRKSSEKVAEEYLKELIDKSLVMVSKRRSDGGVRACVVHDLLHDLCLKKCKEEHFLDLVDRNHSIYEKKGHRVLLVNQHLRSPFGKHVRSFHGHPPESPSNFLHMKLLRVLNFQGNMYPPRLIGTEYLVQLKYLVICGLSASIGRLVNLEYLHVENDRAIRIPSAVLKMVKLRYLELNCSATFERDCNCSQTNKLEVLSKVIIKEHKDEQILKCSPHLRKLKCTCEPLSEGKGADRCLDLHLFTQLESLSIKFHGC